MQSAFDELPRRAERGRQRLHPAARAACASGRRRAAAFLGEQAEKETRTAGALQVGLLTVWLGLVATVKVEW